MPIPMARRILTLALLGVLLPAGCGGKIPAIAEVEGTLSWRGTPLQNVVVEFLPDETSGNSGARSEGVTDAAGHYVLHLSDGRSGAEVGSYRVVLIQGGRAELGGESRNPRRKSKGGSPAPGDTVSPVDPQILAPVESFEKTPLRKQVQSGKQTIDISLP